MTIEELFSAMSALPLVTLLVFLFPPLYALALRFLLGHERATVPPWRYMYGFLVYVTCIPGMFVGVITAYQLFVQGENLVKLDLLVYFLPVLSMAATLLIIKTRIDFRDIPGFNRLSGLLLMLGAAFAAALIIDRLRIIVLFHGSILWLFGIAAVIFFAIKLGASRLFKRRKKEESF